VSDVDVLRLITRLNIGGPARQALLLTRALRPEFETLLVTGTPPPEEGELGDPEVEPHRASLVRPLSPRDDARAVQEVRRLIRDHRPALLHSHMAKAGTAGRLAARTSRHRPVTVHTFHGHVLEGYFRPAVQQAFLTVERALARCTDVLVAVSETTRDDLLAMGIGRPEQWRVVPLGLDLDRHFSTSGRSGALRQELGLGDDQPLVGLVGRLAPIKDPTVAIDAVAGLDGVHLAIVGDGELRDEVAAHVERRGLVDRVHLLGWRLDIPAVMADLDLAVLSSRNEGTPVALIEAAACGVPAVAADVGGVATVVVDGETGLLVPSEDPGALGEGIAALLADGGRRAAMGAAARVHARRFAADRLVDDVRELYRSLG
jgi:glycosyltransferase involved in cell wall biosynthesis